MLGESIRKNGFWILDFIKGGHVRKHYNDIKEICEKKDINKERIENYLYNLLRYATNETDFYKEYRSFKSIKDFPIIDKNTIKNNEENILSKEYRGKELHVMRTSGSTGTPLIIKQNKNKRNRVLAELIYFGELCKFNIGERNVYLRVWTELNKKSYWDARKKNLLMLDVSKLDEECLETIRNTLKGDNKIKCILGYASRLDIISKYLLEKKDSPKMFNINIVISGAEVLMETTRTNLKKIFECNVVSRYSNQENGILAQEPLNSKYFIINDASYFIEFLKIDSDEEAESGELSRIVVTDLFNYAIPMIRYDTGDLGIYKNDPDFGRVITSIEGRKLDFIYDTSGNKVSPGGIIVNMWKYDKMRQFQLIQEGKLRYVLKLNGAKGVYKDEEFTSLIKEKLGKDADISIEHVEGIPSLKSGKFQPVICKYNSKITKESQLNNQQKNR